MVELRQVEIFLALTDELHFARAAEQLRLSPSRISQAVRELEQTVGGVLFERTSRRVSLTPLGAQLRDDLRAPYRALRQAVERARDSAEGVSGALRIGMNSLPAGGPHLTPAVRTFVETHPTTRVSVTDGVGLRELRRGEVDALACRLPVSEPDLTIGPVLSREERVLLVAADSPVAARGHATLEDVADHVVLQPELFTDEIMDAWVPRTAPSGRPIVRHRRPSCHTAEVLNLVALGEVVHPTVTSFLTYYRHPGVAYIPLRGMTPSSAALVWLTAADSALLRAFVATIQQLVDRARADDGA